MSKKVALITGMSGGIGEIIAKTLAKSGFDIVGTYNENIDSAKKIEDEICALGVKCVSLKCDLQSEKEIKEMVQSAIQISKHIDILVNNAGISSDHIFQEKTAEIFRNTLNINLVGTFLVSKYVGEQMLKQKSGKIINISSTNGLNTYFPMCLDYDASKAGVISLTHNLAVQFAPNIIVNCIAPGFIATKNEIDFMDEEYIESEVEKILVKRVGEAQDVANLVDFLASDKSNFINNQVITINGGMYGDN